MGLKRLPVKHKITHCASLCVQHCRVPDCPLLQNKPFHYFPYNAVIKAPVFRHARPDL